MDAGARAAGRRGELARLEALVSAIEGRDRGGAGRAGGGVSTGWASVDGLLGPGGGLTPACLHEWFGLDDEEAAPGGPAKRWSPPVSVLVHLAAQAIAEGGVAFWVGPRIWPYPPSLVRAAAPGPDDLLARSVFVDPPDDATRLWAVDVALRCPSARVVVADARRLTMAASRRLQLAAEAGGALALLARPSSERSTLSVASTRWLVRRAASASGPRWILSLLRNKSSRAVRSPFAEDAKEHERPPGSASPSPSSETAAETALEWNHASCAVVEPSHAPVGPDVAGASPLPSRRPAG